MKVKDKKRGKKQMKQRKNEMCMKDVSIKV